MFHYDNGLKLTEIDLAVDLRRRQPRGFISHAHADHMAPHELALCTPATSRLYQHRLGRRRVMEMPFDVPIEWSPLRLTTLPAGHVLGSAMLLAEGQENSLLYTGDFRLRESATAETARPPSADVLVMECTFGDPKYRMPPREETIGSLVTMIQRAFEHGVTPVIHAYVLGKAQEVTRLLTDRGIPVLQHPLIHAVSRIYEECGCSLGNYQEYAGEPKEGHAVIVPPRGQRASHLSGLTRTRTFAVTGWAIDSAASFRLGVDHALPFSDHADYDELFELVERVSPRVIYCTHGPRSFVDRLREHGHNAFHLDRTTQLRLF
jgi:putative mRNA 3-end processing factor